MEIENKINEILECLNNAPWKNHASDYHQTYFKECLRQDKIDGLWMEFGVYRGRSICQFAESTTNNVYGFDCFEGLPEFWDSQNPKDMFNLNGIIPSGAIIGEHMSPFDPSETKSTKPWPKNIKLIKGYFDATLPTFLLENEGNAAFIHIDSDLYSSAKTVLTLLKDRIVKGTIICFDEICDYPDFRKHEIKAFAEFLIETGLSCKCLVYQPSTYSQGCFVIE